MDHEPSAFRPAREKSRTAVFEVVRRDETSWRESSLDLAQGLDVKEMQSKLPPETLDRLFGS
jgi:hypothetical protein